MLLNHHSTVAPPPGSKTHLDKHGEPSDALQHLSLSVLDAFGSVHDILHQSNIKHQQLSTAIGSLPMSMNNTKDTSDHELNGPFCHDEDLLLLKATSQSALAGMENALSLLQDIREYQRSQQPQKYPDGQQKPGTIKTSKKSGLLSPLSMSPSRKISNSSVNFENSAHLSTSHNVSSSSLNKTDDIVNSMDFDGAGGNQLQFDTLSVKSIALTPSQVNLNVPREAKKHSLAPELSRSTPSVNTQGMKTQLSKPEPQKSSAQEQKTGGESS